MTPTAKQTAFLLLDHIREVFFGGAAGGGKSVALLMAALQYVDQPEYSALLLRRTFAQLEKRGALLDMANDWLSGTDAHRVDGGRKWEFPSGATLEFGYIDCDKDKYNYQCFSEDTEILTADGWRLVKDVKVGDIVATMNPETREFEYAPVTQTHDYEYNGKMLSLYQRQGSSFCVTPNHSMFVSNYMRNRKRGDGALRRKEATELCKTDCVPQWCNYSSGEQKETYSFTSDGHNGRMVSFTSEQFADFLGWYIAEGDSYEGVVRISQKNASGRALIETMLKNANLKYFKQKECFSFSSKCLAEWLRTNTGNGANNKRIPQECKSWDRKHLQTLLRSLLDGDGTWYHDGKWGILVTSSKQLADDVCEIALKAGYRPTISLRNDNPEDSPFGTKPRYHICLNRMSNDTLLNKKAQEVDYNGRVYCVTVEPHHTVLTRHRGRVSWSGQSARYHFVGFDELTQFEEDWYRYLFSRTRRTKEDRTNIPIRVRSASNPGNIGHEWVRQRFLIEKSPERLFVPSKLADNPYLDREDYETSMREGLRAIDLAQLLDGNWEVRPSGGLFHREWFDVVDDYPHDAITVRYWDMAATAEGDYTVGLKMAEKDGVYYVLDVRRIRATPLVVEQLVGTVANMDGKATHIYMEQEPGSSGVSNIDNYARRILQGYIFKADRKTGDKYVRALPVSAAAEHHNIKLVRGAWLNAFIDEVEAFPETSHDDQVDALSGAFEAIQQIKKGGVRQVGAINFQFTTEPAPAVVPGFLPRQVI